MSKCRFDIFIVCCYCTQSVHAYGNKLMGIINIAFLDVFVLSYIHNEINCQYNNCINTYNCKCNLKNNKLAYSEFTFESICI